MFAPTPKPLQLSERPLDKKVVSELRELATAMELATDGVTKPRLLMAIRQHIRTNPMLADDPRFLPLFAHRTPPRTLEKTSANKSEEDQAESLKSNKASVAGYYVSRQRLGLN